MNVSDFYDEMDKLAPFNTAMSFDNCGLLIGDKNQDVNACILALDVTNSVIETAIKKNVQLIITHHPVIFDKLSSITADSIVYKLIQNNISVISAHTNLDIANGGVNDILAELCGLSKTKTLNNCDGCCKVGYLCEKISVKDFAKIVKRNLDCPSVAFTNPEKIVQKVAVSSGAGNEFLIEAIKQNVDVFVTGELKHNFQIDAMNANFPIIIAGHHYTESPVLYPLLKKFQKNYPEISFGVCNDFDINFL